jgi:hypothetical protein
MNTKPNETPIAVTFLVDNSCESGFALFSALVFGGISSYLLLIDK